MFPYRRRQSWTEAGTSTATTTATATATVAVAAAAATARPTTTMTPPLPAYNFNPRRAVTIREKGQRRMQRQTP